MKTPIEVKDIREGDWVRCETHLSAHEFRARRDQDNDGWDYAKFSWYLLDRPTPPVELPTEATLGWVVAIDDEDRIPYLAHWHINKHGLLHRNGIAIGRAGAVKSWSPAIAVPASALDELRAGWGGCERTIGTFLAAVADAILGDAS